MTKPLILEPVLAEEEGSAPHAAASTSPDDSVQATAGGGSADGEDDTADDRLEALDQIRAAVLGACDGIVTTGALVTGIAAANASQHQLLLSAVATMASGTWLPRFTSHSFPMHTPY